MDRQRHTCHLCFRRFPNGRALGGHMRSHVASAAPPRLSASASSDQPADVDREAAVVEEEEEEEEEGKELGASYGLRLNPRKSFRLVDPEFSSFAGAEPAGSSCVGVGQDWESHTDSPRAHRRRAAKHLRRDAPTQAEPEPVSSVSDAIPEEGVALSLMMLSRDSWVIGVVDRPSYSSNDIEEGEGEARRPAARSRATPQPPPPPRRGRTRYQCGACKKVFRSYQALGGHRAGHKKNHGCGSVVEAQIYGEVDSVDAKVHQCPFCFRLFSSGQALGGHKRSHFASSAVVTSTTGNSPDLLPRPPCSPTSISPTTGSTTKCAAIGQIDLNLPAPTDDEFELSTISNSNDPN